MKEPRGAQKLSTAGLGLLLGNIGRGRLPIGIREIRTVDGLTQRVLGADGYCCVREPRNFRLGVVHEYHLLSFLGLRSRLFSLNDGPSFERTHGATF